MASSGSHNLQAGPLPHSVLTPEGIAINLTKGSIVKEKADIIVNNTSSSLALGGGTISCVVLKAAGSEIQDECKTKYPAGVKFGEFVETVGGNLNCDVIYHGCVSNWSQGAGEKVLRQLLQSMLGSADTDRMKSIVFPAIGTGNLGFPSDKVAAIMYDEFTEFSKNNGSTSLKKITVCLYDKDTENIKAFEQHINQLVTGGKTSASVSYSLPMKLKTREGVQITVKENDITKEKVDVIINSTGDNLMLNDGTLSKALLQAAGGSIQTECNSNKRAKLSHGDITETSGGKLSVDAIYHGSLPEWNGGQGEKVVSTFVYDCLVKANDDDMESVAIPAIGSGVLKFPHSDSARIIYKAIRRFCKDADDIVLKDVRVVIYDAKSVKAFKTYFGDVKAKKSSKTSSPTSKRSTRQPTMPHTTSSATQGAAAASATSPRVASFDPFISGLSGLFSRFTRSTGPVVMSDVATFTTPSGLNVTIRKGTLTQEKADVLVNVVGKDLNLNHGAITSAVLQAAGSGIEQECKTNAPSGISFGEIVRTSNGNIGTCKAIYHGAVPEWSSGDGEKNLCLLMKTVLEKADSEQFTSVAFPSIGTGLMLGYPAAKVAEYMIDQINIYSAAHPSTSVKNVKIVLFERDNASLKAFESYLQTNTSTTTGARPKNQETPSLPDVPAHWNTMKKDEMYKLVTMSTSNQEYKDVAKKFMDTGGPKTIQKIERVQCTRIHQLYVIRKIQMDADIKNKKNFPVERTLYHGTTGSSLDQINLLGFNRSYGGKNATLYGLGSYFAKDASYSADTMYSPADTQGNRHIYQCKVLTGEYTVGSSGMKIPPPKNPTVPDVLFDTVANNVRNPAIFVVFYDAQAYPEYLITFK